MTADAPTVPKFPGGMAAAPEAGRRLRERRLQLPGGSRPRLLLRGVRAGARGRRRVPVPALRMHGAGLLSGPSAGAPVEPRGAGRRAHPAAPREGRVRPAARPAPGPRPAVGRHRVVARPRPGAPRDRARGRAADGGAGGRALGRGRRRADARAARRSPTRASPPRIPTGGSRSTRGCRAGWPLTARRSSSPTSSRTGASSAAPLARAWAASRPGAGTRRMSCPVRPR